MVTEFKSLHVFCLALVWQLMRGYTLSLLTKISGSDSPINDKAITEWANGKVSKTHLEMKNSNISFVLALKIRDFNLFKGKKCFEFQYT